MKRSRRVTAIDVRRAGSLIKLMEKLIGQLRTGTMDVKEKAADSIHSLTMQPMGLDPNHEQKEENIVLLAHRGVIPQLIALVTTGSTLAQAHACGALATMAHNLPQYQQEILEANGVPALVHALRMGDAGAQQLASEALASVSELQASVGVMMQTPGAVPVLVGLLKGSVSDETAVSACRALAHLSDGNLEGQNMIAKAGAITLLIGLLESGKAPEAAATLLARLTHGHRDNRLEVVQLGGIPQLIALLSVINWETQAQAASAIAAITSGVKRDVSHPPITGEEEQAQTLRHVVAKAGGLPPLLALVDSHHLNTQRASVNALAMLSMNCPENQMAIAGMGGIAPLVLLCEPQKPPEVQAEALLALSELARHNNKNQTDVAEAGAVSLLASLMRSTNSPDVEREIAGCFWALSEDHPANKILIARAIPVLVELLGSATARSPILAANALSSLALGNEDNQVEIARLLVTMLLESDRVETQQEASTTAWRIVRENPGDELKIARAGGAGPLVRLLRESRLTRVKAFALLCLSLAIDETNQAAVAEEDGVEPLVNLLSLADENTREQAACAIQRLALNNGNTQLQITKQGAVQPLIELLDPACSSKSREFAAAALAQLGQCELGRDTIDANGGVQPLVTLLCDETQGPSAKQHAAAALCRLAQEKPKAPADKDGRRAGAPAPAEAPASDEGAVVEKVLSSAEVIARAGAIDPLVSLLSGDHGEEAQEEAAGALTALARYESNRIEISTKGGIGPLVALLGSPNARAREHAEFALVRLSIESSTRVLIIEQLVSMLKDDSGTDSQEQAAAALANLARESVENRNSILKADGIPSLLNLYDSTSRKAKENSASAISQLANKNRSNQNAIANAGGIKKMVATLISAQMNIKEISGLKLCTLIVEGIWHMADGNAENQTALYEEGCIPPIVASLNNPDSQMQTNSSGALACLSRGHPANQAAVARSGALAPLCTMVRDAADSDTREEAAAALWALAADNPQNKSTIAKLGGLEPLVNMLIMGTTEKSAVNSAGALATLSAKHADNRQTIAKRIILVLGNKASPDRAVRVLSSLVEFCQTEPANQIAVAKGGVIQHLLSWLDNPTEVVQAEAARAMLALASNNPITQGMIAKEGGVPPLVEVIKKGSLDAHEHSTCALWHLASLNENHKLLKQCGAIPAVVALLPSEGKLAPLLASMLLLRLAENSTRAAVAVADAGAIPPLVRLLTTGSPSTRQMAAGTLAAIARISQTRDAIAHAEAFEPLIKLLWSELMGTPETAVRTLSHLARNELDYDDVSEGGETDEEDEEEEEENKDDRSFKGRSPPASRGVSPPASRGESQEEMVSAQNIIKRRPVARMEQVDALNAPDFGCGAARRYKIHALSGVSTIVKMLDGSNLPGSGSLKPGAIGGWVAVQIGVLGAIEAPEIFPGSQVDFGVRVGMQEQAAATLADLSDGDGELQDAIIEAGGVPPLLSLVQCGSSLAQEHAARAIWHLSTATCNQQVIVKHYAIPDLVALVKSGTSIAQEMAAATLSQLAHGYFIEHKGKLGAFAGARRGSMASRRGAGGGRRKSKDLSDDGAAAVEVEVAADGEGASEAKPPPTPDLDDASVSPSKLADSNEQNRLLVIAEAGGIPPLVKLAEFGTAGGREKGAGALRHLAADPDNRVSIASNGGIKPLVQLLADGNEAALDHASHALTTLATGNAENQAQIAKKLVSLLDHDDANVISRAARDLQSLARDHPGAPVVIVNAGAIMPLVTVLSNGKTEQGRTEAGGTLATLASSGPENQLAIAIGLVGLLGVGTDQAQEYVTALLLDLSSGLESDLENRRAIANAGPFRMLVQQMRSESFKVKQLAAAVMSKLSGDSDENILEIAKSNGIPPLVALLDVDDPETQEHAAVVITDMTRSHMEHAEAVKQEGGIPLLVALLTDHHTIHTKGWAAHALGNVAKVNPREVGQANAVKPLVKLLKTKNLVVQQKAAYALMGIAAGGTANQDSIRTSGGIDLLVGLLSRVELPSDTAESAADQDMSADDTDASRDPTPVVFRQRRKSAEARAAVTEGAIWKVQAYAAQAIAELAKDSPTNQSSIAAAGGIMPIITLLKDNPKEAIKRDEPKEQAAHALFCLASGCSANQEAIANAGGISTLVNLIANTTDKGQLMAAEALASLALDSAANQKQVAELLVGLLRTSGGRGREKTARAISRFSNAHMSNQNAMAAAGGIDFVVSLIAPRKAEKQRKGFMMKLAAAKDDPDGAKDGEAEDEDSANAVGEHHLIQKELASALWKMSSNNQTNQTRVANCGAIPLLISLIDDHDDIHRDAAGALWSLAADTENQQLIADAGGIPALVGLLQSGKKNLAQETAAGALHSLALRAENRDLIADAGEVGGITQMVPLLETGTEMAKEEVSGALLTLVIDNPPNQFLILTKLVAMIHAGPADASDIAAGGEAMRMRVEAQEHATNVIYHLSGIREYRQALTRLSLLREEENAIAQLVRLLKGGSERAQKNSAEALTQIARMSTELRIQVTQWLVTLLANPNADVRQRAGKVLQEMNEGKGEDQKVSRDAAMAGGVEKLIDLLRDGLKNDRVEAQEYALWSLSVASNPKSIQSMVRAGCIPLLIQALSSGKLSEVGQENTSVVLACLALDASCHDEIVSSGGVQPLVKLLTGTTYVAMKHAAIALERLASSSTESQSRIAEQGAIEHLVTWLHAFADLRLLVNASAPADEPLQAVAEDETVKETITPADVPADAPVDVSAAAPAAAPATAPTAEPAAAPTAAPAAASSVAVAADQAMALAPAAMDSFAEAVGAFVEEFAPAPAPAQAPTVDKATPDPEDELVASDVLSKTSYDPMLQGLAPVAAFALAALARSHAELQQRITVAGAIAPLIVMISDFAEPEAQIAACQALATLAQGSHDNQLAVAKAGSIPPLVRLIGSSHLASHEDASRAISLLALHDEHKAQIVKTGGLKPLVELLGSRNEATQMYGATALELLANSNKENQGTLAQLQASAPLMQMLSAEAEETAQSAVDLLMCLADHPASLKTVIRRLVEALIIRNTRSQLKATEALAVLSTRNLIARTAIVKAGAISPLVSLLGNGMRAEDGTPPERAAAVLAELARLAESKHEIATCGGLDPLVKLLSSSSEASRTHAAAALYRLSTAGDSKADITALGGIPPLVNLLRHGSVQVKRHAAGTLWQLAAYLENKNAIVNAGGIEALVAILQLEESEVLFEKQSMIKPTPRRGARTEVPRELGEPITPLILAKESAAAVLAELARSQPAFKVAIVTAAGIPPLIRLMMSSSLEAKRHATGAIWGLACEPKYRRAVAAVDGTVEYLVGLLRDAEGETQGFAAGTLVCIAGDENGRRLIRDAGGPGPLMSLALGPDSWLRAQCVQVLTMLGYPDPKKANNNRSSTAAVAQFANAKDTAELDDMLALLGYTDDSGNSKKFAPGMQDHVVVRRLQNPMPTLVEYSNPHANYMPTSPRSVRTPRSLGAAACGPSGVRLSANTGKDYQQAVLSRFKAILASNPAMWMLQEKKTGVSDDHMAEIAAHFKMKDRVIVTPGEAYSWERKAIVMYIGKVPEIAPGFWVGIQFKDKSGKNDGSINGARYFNCPSDFGGFVRPSRIEADTSAAAEAPAAAPVGGKAMSRRSSVFPQAAEDPAATSKASGRRMSTQQQAEEIVAEPARVKAVDKPREVVESASVQSKKPKLRLARDPASTSAKEKSRAPTARMGSESKADAMPSQREAGPSSQRNAAPSQRKGASSTSASQRNAAPSGGKPQPRAAALSAVQEEITSTPEATAAALTVAFEQHSTMRETVEISDVPLATKRKGGMKKKHA